MRLVILSIFRYPGGKTRRHVQEKILSRLPRNYAEYREPFVGGGGIFFALDGRDYVNKNRWINDLNEGLIEVYKALRDRPEEFYKLCKNIEPAKPGEEEVASRESSKSKKTYNKRLKAIFDSLKYNEHLDQALRYFFINRTVWGGRVNYDPKMESRMYFSNPSGWNIVKGSRLLNAGSHLKRTKITLEDYSVLFEEPGENVVIYADPPYVVNSSFTDHSQLYANNFDMSDHERFVDVVKKCKHRILISYDDDPDGLVRSWFREDDGFFVYEETWKYSGTSSAEGASKKKKTGQELIITNYDADKVDTVIRGKALDVFG